MIPQHKIFSRVALFITTYSLIIVAAVAFPSARPGSSGQRNPFDPTLKPNVALFNLPATITPPGPVTLKFVYQGFGIALKSQV